MFKGTYERKRLRNESDPAQLSFSSSWQTPWTEDPVHTGPTAHLLPETGGPGPSSTNSGKDLHGYSAILKKHEHKCVICKDDRLKAPNARFYHWTLLVNLLLSHWFGCWKMSDIVQETIIFLTRSLKKDYGTSVSTASRCISVQWNRTGHCLYIFVCAFVNWLYCCAGCANVVLLCS